MKKVILLIVLITGCSSVPNNQIQLKKWGPGVKDVDRFLEQMNELVERARKTNTLQETSFESMIYGMFEVLTWKQATYVYRNGPKEFKPLFLMLLVDCDVNRYMGMTRDQIVKLLGPPDKDDGTLIYTGTGVVHDGDGANMFHFDENGKLIRIIMAN